MMEKNEAMNMEENGANARPLETIFTELDEILVKMQDPEVTLEESFVLYETGMKDIRQCNVLLDQIAISNAMFKRPSPARTAISSPNATQVVFCPRRYSSLSIAGRSS